MDSLVELTTFYPIVEQHGLSKWWLYKQLSRLSFGLKRGVLPSGRSTSSMLIPFDEVMHLVLCASKKKSIENIIHLAWTVVYGKRMTYIASKSHGTWQRHYAIPRDKGRIAIADPEDLFALRPRFLFFKDNLDELERVIAPRYYRKLAAFLDDTERKARKFIGKQSKSQAMQNKLAHCDYEEFYHLMLDAMIYGAAEETAFAEALKKVPKRSDKGSSKEYLTANEGAIENFAESTVNAQDTSYAMDFEKLRRSFGELLLRERITAMKPRKDRPPSDGEEVARALAAEDMAILDCVLEGLTDEEILTRLGLSCTRQALCMRRARIMELAKGHFLPLVDG